MASPTRSFASVGALVALVAISGCHTPRSNVPPGLGFGKNRAGMMKQQRDASMDLNPYGANGAMGPSGGAGMGMPNPAASQGGFGNAQPTNGGMVQYGNAGGASSPFDSAIQPSGGGAGAPVTATPGGASAGGSSYVLPSGTSVTNMPPATGGSAARNP